MQYRTPIDKDNPKTDRSMASFPLMPNMLAYLKHVKQMQENNKAMCGDCYIDSDFVCVNPDGSRIKPDYMSRAIPEYL